MSEGGASFYARKIQSRIAIEKQKTQEEQRQKFDGCGGRRPLPGLPDVLGAKQQQQLHPESGSSNSSAMQQQQPQQIYRVVGGRKHVQKAEMGMQTDTNSAINGGQKQQQPFDWKKAMAHNARVLSSQEKAMDEYLRRQRAAAEQHIQAANRMMVVDHGGMTSASVPTTPSQVRRVPNCNNPASSPSSQQQQQHYLQQRHHSSLESHKAAANAAAAILSAQQGGSLERAKLKVAQHQQAVADAYSDSEYGRLLGSPMSSRRASNGHSNTPSPTPSANGGKRDPVFGSRSLPKGTSSLNYGLMLDRIQQKRQHRPNKINDGSLSDSNYATYTDLQGMRGPGPGQQQHQSPYSWLQPASTYSPSSVQDPYAPWMGNQPPSDMESAASFSDVMGSNESLNSVSSSIQQARANSLTKARLMMHQRSMSPKSSLKRGQQQQQQLLSHDQQSFVSSGSAASKDTDYYGIPFNNYHQRGQQQSNGIARFKSQPTSPTKTQLVTIGEQPLSSLPPMPLSSGGNAVHVVNNNAYGMIGGGGNPNIHSMQHHQQYSSLPCYKGGEAGAMISGGSVSARTSAERDLGPKGPHTVHGSNMSLAAAATLEAKTDSEIRKLRKELQDEHDKVQNLTSQLTTNAHVVAAFEQSLANMTNRLQQLTTTSEKKDSELNELRRTIDRLRQSGADAGLCSRYQKTSEHTGQELQRQMSTDSVVSVSSQSGDELAGKPPSGKSASLGKGQQGPKRSGWLRHSFSKAFSKGGKQDGRKSSKGGSLSDAEDGSITKMLYEKEVEGQKNEQPTRSASAASGNVLDMQQQIGSGGSVKGCQSSSAINHDQSDEMVGELKRQLMEKESLLTETRLEALSSAHQLESLRETVSKMRNELMSLKSDNERLQTVVQIQHHGANNNNNKSLNSSQSSLNCSGSGSGSTERGGKDADSATTPSENMDGDDAEEQRRHSVTMSEASVLSGPSSLDLSGSTDPTNKDGGKLVTVSVAKGEVGNDEEIRLGMIAVSGKSNWDLLDSLVHRLFKEYVMRVDPVSNLGLNADSISNYEVGEIFRTSTSRKPEFLPYGYLVGDTTNIKVNLKRSYDGNFVDALAFETLVPKAIIQRYVSLLVEHKRVILSGPMGTGKTFIAKKLANFLVHRKREVSNASSMASSPLTPTASTSSLIDNTASVVTFSIDMNNVNELRQFLARISDQCTASENPCLPKVIILDNLQLAGKLEEIFNGFLTASFDRCPYIIGTLNLTANATSTTNLQLQHNFRWVLCVNHVEPVRGFLGRYLRQKLLAVEVQTRMHDGEMSAVIEWVVKVHIHLNKFLEAHSSSEATLGPKHFLTCPMDVKSARTWFINLWNCSLVPHLSDSLRDGLQLYGRRVSWEDPAKYILETWPWAGELPGDDLLGNEALVPIRPEDVGYDESAPLPVNNTSANSKTSRPASGSDSMGSGEDGSNSSRDPLFNMLMHLQEAAANNGPLNESNEQ